MTLDLTKPVQTRDGRPVRILATDIKTRERPIIIAVLNPEGHESVYALPPDGAYVKGYESAGDLINVPPPRKTSFYTVRKYPDDPGYNRFIGPYDTFEGAKLDIVNRGADKFVGIQEMTLDADQNYVEGAMHLAHQLVAKPIP